MPFKTGKGTAGNAVASSCRVIYLVSMPFKTGKGTAGRMKNGFGASLLLVSMPFKTGKGTAGLVKAFIAEPLEGVSMPFKTGKGTAGTPTNTATTNPKKFQCPLRRARVLRGEASLFPLALPQSFNAL